MRNRIANALLFGIGVLILFLYPSCSNQKNTASSRFYHSVNTRYNVHFNAKQAYDEALKVKEENREENLSEWLYIYPDNSDTTALESAPGGFTVTIDKSTKAIKLHSIKARPKRDPGRRNDPRYQAWLQQREFNPFMHNVWLLLGKAEFHDGNYLRAISTFMYTTKIYSSNPSIVAECRLWIAKAYTEMGWMYEAGNVLHKLELAGGVPDNQKGLYSSVKANYLVRNNEFEAAIPHLEYAIKKEKDKIQRIRMRYLLGQIYVKTGEDVKAQKAFEAVKGMNVPYKYSFNARLHQMELEPSKDKVIESLTKMAKNGNNENYLDQIYTSIGTAYMHKADTAKAMENYRKAVKLSVRNGYDRAMTQVRLADLYFSQRKFILAQPHYSEALPLLKKKHPDYRRVSHRSEVLDELVVHAKIVYEQDSLQHLAQLPEVERMQIINDKIADLRKQEAEKKKEEERQKKLEERNERIQTWGDLENEMSQQSKVPPSSTLMPGSGIASRENISVFYFYNPQTVAQGKIAFQTKWGNRKLEDDWRRREKSNSGFQGWSNDSDTIQAVTGKNKQIPDEQGLTQPEGAGGEPLGDVYSPEYYLQQLPLTPEAIKESNDLIDNALFNMGKIYKNKLEDMDLAIDAFTTNIRRFPDTPNLEEIYYQLFLIYMQTGNRDMMASYRNKLLNEFPDGVYAVPLSEPDYEWNFRHMAILQDSLYDATYTAYLAADIRTVRDNYQSIKTKYPFADLMPKFAFLNALTYAQTRDVNMLSSTLKELTEKYPKADVTPLATEILSRIKDGKILLSDGTPIRGIDWSGAFAGAAGVLDEDGAVIEFADNTDKAEDNEYVLLLMYRTKSIDRNELLYEVADYNFSNYIVQTFDLAFDQDPPNEMLIIKGFQSLSNVKSYLNRAFEEGSLVEKLDTAIVMVPISVDNYVKGFTKLGLERYKAFFAEHYAAMFPQLVAYWDNNKAAVETLLQVPDEKTKTEPEKKVPEPKIEENVEPIPQNTEKDKPKVPAEPKKEVNDKEITADDLLTKGQLETLGKANDVINSLEETMSNPVDGIKNLFKSLKNKQNLTKEEKAELKEEQRQEKERQKELRALAKARQDSINKVEKALKISIAKAEKAAQDSIDTIERQKEEQIRIQKAEQRRVAEAAIKAKEDARKEKAAERKEKERLQKERLRQREKERNEKEKAREKERKQKEKEAEENRKKRIGNKP